MTEPLVTAALAIGLDALLGDPPNRFHPVAAMGAWIRWTTAHVLAHDSTRQFIYGILLVAAGTALFTMPLIALGVLLTPYPLPAILIEALLLKSVFSLRRLLESGREVQRALEKNDLSAARRVVGWHLVSRDTGTLDAGHVASAAVESLAENFSDSFVAPLLAFLIGGLPLAFAYRFVNTADAMIGYHDERHEHLGKFAARLDDVLNWIPARLSGLLIVWAAPLAGGDWRGAWGAMRAQHLRTASPNAGWPMSAAAGALSLRLEKIGYYRLEGGAELPDPQAIGRAGRLVLAAAGIWAVICAIMTLVIAHAT